MPPHSRDSIRESAPHGDRTSADHASNSGADLSHVAQEAWGAKAAKHPQNDFVGAGASGSIQADNPVGNIERAITDLFSGPRLSPFVDGTTLRSNPLPSILPNLDLY